MRWLVTGGAGFLGINLVRHLLARGDQVTSLDRQPFDYPERAQITEIRGDIRNRGDVERAVQGCQVVVHAAASLPGSPAAEVQAIDVDGTRTLLEAADGRRVVQLSSTAVYGIPSHSPLVESDPRSNGPHGATKVAVERICEDFRQRGQTITILRPKSIVGPERLGAFALLFEWARDGRDFPILGKGTNRYQLLDVHDLCSAIVLAGTVTAERANKTFNVGAHEFTTLKEDFQAVLDAAGHARRVRTLPVTPALWALRRLEVMRLSPLHPWIYETVTENSYVSIEKARHELGWMPRYSNKAALVRNYRWYCDNADKLGEAGVTHRGPWKQGALALAKLVFRART